jgi:hypothetical protein
MNTRFERLIFFTIKTRVKENSNLPLVTKSSFDNPNDSVKDKAFTEFVP